MRATATANGLRVHAIAGTYVVLLSALDFNASYEGTRAIAPDVCIAKPVRAQLLSAALKASRLPRAAMPESSEPARRQSTTERETLPEFGLRVLVVDDNAINREVAVAMLDELRCTVVVAGDGPSAVANAQQQRFDVIFMDCQMPGMDGYAATEAIRRHESEHGQAATPIVALTANVLARDRDRCLAAGMNAFLSKPFRSAQLVEVLTPIAEARGPAETTAVEPPSPVGLGTTTQSKASPTSLASPLICHEPDMHITNAPDLKSSIQLTRLSPTSHTSEGVMSSSCQLFRSSAKALKPGVSTVKLPCESISVAPMLIAGPAKR